MPIHCFRMALPIPYVHNTFRRQARRGRRQGEAENTFDIFPIDCLAIAYCCLVRRIWDFGGNAMGHWIRIELSLPCRVVEHSEFILFIFGIYSTENV